MKKLALLCTLLTVGACSSDDGPRSKMCQEACSTDADCVTTGTTVDDWKCQGARCVFEMCANDADCIPLRSDWNTACTDGGGECPQNWTCINVGGGGLCAPVPGVVACSDYQMTEIQMPAIDGSGDITVCGNTDFTCDNGECVDPCEEDSDCHAPMPFCVDGTCVQCKSDDDCAGGAFTRCNSSGGCGCADDSECSGGLSKCTSLGVCGCVDDTECTQSTRDKCYDGLCGCSSADVCTGNTQGAATTWVCEKF